MSQTTLHGGCLCGSVQYEVSGDANRFYHCHCHRCRKASGTGHATNLILQPGTVTWVAGEALLRRYKVPEAERFFTCFCSNCGSPLPRVVPELELVVIPAGSLDSAKVRDAALALRAGGVGYYRKSDFVHVDTGRVRHW